MMIRRRHWAIQTGYDIVTDYAYGFRLCLGFRKRPGLYRLLVEWHFDWPRFVWAEEHWVLGEPGYIRGLPVLRQGIASSAWTGRKRWLRTWSWPHKFEVRRFD